MASPKYQGIPVGRLLIVLSLVFVIGLAAYGAQGLFGMLKITDYPITGEWQAKGKPWRIDFRADKTIVSSTGPSQTGASQDSQEWAKEPGTYKVDLFGSLWIMLKNGKTYSAILASAAENIPAASRDRFDLIESGTESVTVFEKVQPAKPKTTEPPQDTPNPNP